MSTTEVHSTTISEAALLPVLQEPILEAMRAADQRHLRRSFFAPFACSQPVSPPAAMLPVNPWLILVDRIAVDATAAKAVKIPRQKPGVPTRSPFRTGTLIISADGFRLQGIGTQPVAWMQQIGCWAFLLFFVFAIASNLVAGTVGTYLRLMCLVMIVIGCVSGTIASAVAERRRGEQDVFVAWGDLIEAQFDPGMCWVALVYYGPPPHPGGTGSPLYLPLNQLSPALAGALWDTVETYAPGKTRAEAGGYTWTTQRRLIAAVLVGIILDIITLIIYMSRHF